MVWGYVDICGVTTSPILPHIIECCAMTLLVMVIALRQLQPLIISLRSAVAGLLIIAD